MVEINQEVEDFEIEAFHNEEIKKIKLSDYKGKWTILFFYPADFTFVCPTELGELADRYDQIKALGADIISVSTDTGFVHKAWHDNSETIKKIRFAMLSDPTGEVCKKYGTYIAEEGLSLRGTFFIDPKPAIESKHNLTVIAETATVGMKRFIESLD